MINKKDIRIIEAFDKVKKEIKDLKEKIVVLEESRKSQKSHTLDKMQLIKAIKHYIDEGYKTNQIRDEIMLRFDIKPTCFYKYLKNSLYFKKALCYHCGHSWNYKGQSKNYLTCPSCYYKIRVDRAINKESQSQKSLTKSQAVSLSFTKSYNKIETRIINKIRRSKRRVVISEINKLLPSTTIQDIKIIIVDERGLCSKASFYRYIHSFKSQKLIETETGLRLN